MSSIYITVTLPLLSLNGKGCPIIEGPTMYVESVSKGEMLLRFGETRVTVATANLLAALIAVDPTTVKSELQHV